ncbi:peroxiredoxin [Spiroplasma tabanidicola]|uniref:thioredoxin-dependent peroxiredoxin n=1 Tax=Spiroplasma tabanidicola TaxID=324079 RepID=A0A6I6CJW4_9MOLU|nr:peroxiredoxin [Spiroplasma tabanidicola]QGS52383.1 peroxiredoxin [Spiroplasma tabanidicola]
MLLENNIYELDTQQESSLSGLMGSRGLVLFFYPKASTPGCTREVNEYSKLKKEFDLLQYNIVGVSADNVEDQNKFACNNKLEFPLIADKDKKLINELSLWGSFKNTNGILMEGTRRCTFIINTNLEVIKSFMDVNPTEHVKEVLEFLKTRINESNKTI